MTDDVTDRMTPHVAGVSGIPAPVRAALEQRKGGPAGARRRASLWSTRIVRGDLRVVRPLVHVPAESRLAVVLSVDPNCEVADVLLTHTAPELATPSDVVLERAASSAPYDVVVQTDIRGVVWTLQLGHAAGHLADDALEAVAGAAGLERLSPDDPRRSFKDAETAALRALTRDCTEALGDGREVWSLDPGLLDPDVLSGDDAPERLLYELLHWTRTRNVALTDAALVRLGEAGAFDLERWRSLGDLGDLGLDVVTSLQELLLDAATGAVTPEDPGRRWVTTARLQAGAGGATHDEHIQLLGRKHQATA